MASRKWRMGLYIRIMGCLEQGMLQARFVKNTLVSSRMEEMFTRKPKMIWRVSWKLQMFLCELISFSAVKLHGTLMLWGQLVSHRNNSNLYKSICVDMPTCIYVYVYMYRFIYIYTYMYIK
jgi:hypothetical protein